MIARNLLSDSKDTYHLLLPCYKLVHCHGQWTYSILKQSPFSFPLKIMENSLWQTHSQCCTLYPTDPFWWKNHQTYFQCIENFLIPNTQSHPILYLEKPKKWSMKRITSKVIFLIIHINENYLSRMHQLSDNNFNFNFIPWNSFKYLK